MTDRSRLLAVVTGASTGIGYELAKQCAEKKDDPADVAKTGFKAMMKGEGDVVTGWHNKLQTAIASIAPAGMLAEQHRKMAQPGSADQ